METQIKKFTELCIKFRKFAYETNRTNGWETIYSECIGKEVQCYFSLTGDEHTAVTIENIEVGFHNLPKIAGSIHLFTEDNFKKIIKKYTKILKELILEQKKKTKIEIQQEKDGKIEALKQQLKELEK